MGLEYLNRHGDKYFLVQGKTKTGKPKYYAARKQSGVAVDELPEGFEFYENPAQGLVTIRKIRPTAILPAEREQMEEWVRELGGLEHFCVEIEDNSLVVHTPSRDPEQTDSIVAKLFGTSFGSAMARDMMIKHDVYQAMFRFKLIDKDRRLFSVARWCFKGSIDDWFPLSAGKPLEVQARKVLPHLKQQSFFELF